MCGGMQLGNDLTKRCSQPLTSTVSYFKFGKQLSMLWCDSECELPLVDDDRAGRG